MTGSNWEVEDGAKPSLVNNSRPQALVASLPASHSLDAALRSSSRSTSASLFSLTPRCADPTCFLQRSAAQASLVRARPSRLRWRGLSEGRKPV